MCIRDRGVFGSSLTAAADMTVLATFKTALARFVKLGTGNMTRSMKNMRFVFNVAGLEFLYSIETSGVTLVDWLQRNTGGIMCTGLMPASYTHNTDQTSDTFLGVRIKPGWPHNSVGKVWGGGVGIARNDTERAPRDEIEIVGTAYYDFKLTLGTTMFESNVRRV